MKQFKDFGIKVAEQSFIGDKIKIDRILNREIVVHDFKIEPSKYEGKGKCLYMQIELSGNKHVVFTGAGQLMEVIQKVEREDFPFQATIIKENDRFKFT